MTLELPADAEPFGEDWAQPGCYILRYERPENLQERAERAFDNLPEWFDLLQSADKILYVGMSSNVMRRLEDHQKADKRLTTLSRCGCEPVGIINIIYHESADAADLAEYNTAKRVARQTDEATLTICNGEPV